MACRATADTPALPSAPSGLVANGTNSSVILSWDANAVSEQVASYKVYSSTNRGGPFSLLGTVTATTYTDSAAVSGTTYWYRVIASNSNGDSPYTDVSGSFVTDSTAPANPTITTTTVTGATSVTLTWTPPSDADYAGCKVYARISPAAYALVSGSNLVTNNTFEHTAATAGFTWDYKVTSLDFGGNESTGSTSSIAVPATDTTAPAVPSTPVAVGTTSGNVITWSANTEPDLASYDIFRSDDGYTTRLTGAALPTTPTSFTDTTATVGVAYTYKILARDASGNTSAKSTASNSVTRPSTTTTSDLSSFIRAGTMVPCAVHARGVGGQKYLCLENQGAGASVSLTGTDDFPALGAGTVLTTKYEWNFAAGSNQPPGAYASLRGFNAAHAYDVPGTYTVRLDRTDSAGTLVRYEANVSLAADTRRKVYVSSTGSGSSTVDGSSISSPVNLARAASIIAGTDNVKLVLKNGDKFDCSTSPVLVIKRANTMITNEEGFGDSTAGRPVFEFRTNVNGTFRDAIKIESTATNPVIENLRVNQTYSAASTEKKGDSLVRIFGSVNVLIRNIGITSIGTPIAVDDGGSARYILVQDCQVNGDAVMRGNFCYVKAQDVVFLGLNIPGSKGEHGIRARNATRLLISNCTLADTTVSGVESVAKHPLIMQEGMYVYVTQCTITSTSYQGETTEYMEIGPLDDDNGLVASYLRYAVLERCTINCKVRIKPNVKDCIVRNNIITNGDAVIRIEASMSSSNKYGESYSSRVLQRLYIYNNTIKNDGASGSRHCINMSGLVNDTAVFANNLGLQTAFLNDGVTFCVEVDLNTANLPGTSVSFDRNVWPALDKFRSGSTTESVGSWNNRSFVGTDAVENVSVNGLFKVSASAANKAFARPVAGVFEDFYGTARSRLATSWVPGAVEGTY